MVIYKLLWIEQGLGGNCVYVTWWSNSMPFIRIRGKMLKLYLSHLGPPCLLRNSEFLQKNAVYLLVKVWVSCWQRAPACTFSARTSIDVPAKTWGKSGALFTVPCWALGWWIRLIESALGRFLGDHPHPSGFAGYINHMNQQHLPTKSNELFCSRKNERLQPENPFPGKKR